MNLIVLQKLFLIKTIKKNSIPVNEIISQMKPTFCT